MAKQTLKNAGTHRGRFLHTPLFTKLVWLNAKRFNVYQKKKKKLENAHFLLKESTNSSDIHRSVRSESVSQNLTANKKKPC